MVSSPARVRTAFVHDHFFGQAVAVNGLLEKSGNRRFVAAFGQHKVNGIAKTCRPRDTGRPIPPLILIYVSSMRQDLTTVRLRLFAARVINGE